MANDPTQSPFDLAAEEADKLLTAANVARMRGNLQVAEEKVRQALQVKPDLPTAHGLLGHLLLARGDAASALGTFKRALELHPGHAKYEEGYARATLAVAEEERKKTLAMDAATGARMPIPPRNATLATLASLVIPGGGQLYNGQVAKAVLFLALVVGMFLLGTLLSGGQIVKWFSSQIGPQITDMYNPENPGGSGLHVNYRGAVNPVGVALVVLAFVAYIWNLVDATLTASRLNRQESARSGWEV